MTGCHVKSKPCSPRRGRTGGTKRHRGLALTSTANFSHCSAATLIIPPALPPTVFVLHIGSRRGGRGKILKLLKFFEASGFFVIKGSFVGAMNFECAGLREPCVCVCVVKPTQHDWSCCMRHRTDALKRDGQRGMLQSHRLSHNHIDEGFVSNIITFSINDSAGKKNPNINYPSTFMLISVCFVSTSCCHEIRTVRLFFH